jgi:hypothetical protein
VPRRNRYVAAVLALAFPAALLQAAPGAQAAAAVVLFDQTGNAATPSGDSSAANFSPSNYFSSGTHDRGADDFTVPAGATWAINEIDVTGAFSTVTTGTTVNVYLYANDAGHPGAELFSQLGITATGAPNFVVPLTGVPALTSGTYWVTVQYVSGGGGSYWSWGTSTVQRGNPAQWRSINAGTPCPVDTWAPRTTCFTGTNPDQVFVLKGTDLTPVPSNAFSLGKPILNKKAGTAATPVTVPGAGTLTLGGKGVAAQNQVTSGAGTVQFKVKAKGAAKRKLNRTGKVTVTVAVTFIPNKGVPNTVTQEIKLRKKVG